MATIKSYTDIEQSKKLAEILSFESASNPYKNNIDMKANEGPEKIYMTPSFGEPDNVLLASFSKSHLNFHRDIEYTRTDAFIEKVCKWLEPNVKIILCGDKIDTNKFIEDFKNYMKEE